MTYDGVKTKLGPTLRRIENVKKILGGTPLYKLYRYVPPHWVGFLRRFGLKTGNHTLCPIWSGIGYGFRGSYGVYEPIYRFSIIPNE